MLLWFQIQYFFLLKILKSFYLSLFRCYFKIFTNFKSLLFEFGHYYLIFKLFFFFIFSLSNSVILVLSQFWNCKKSKAYEKVPGPFDTNFIMLFSHCHFTMSGRSLCSKIWKKNITIRIDFWVVLHNYRSEKSKFNRF